MVAQVIVTNIEGLDWVPVSRLQPSGALSNEDIWGSESMKGNSLSMCMYASQMFLN